MRKSGIVVVALCGALVAAWWMVARQSPPATVVTADTSSSAPLASPAPAIDQPVSADPTTPAMPQSQQPAPSSSEPLSTSERKEVTAFATTFMKAFARPSRAVSTRVWWAKVASMLGDDAVDAYLGTEPSMVPFTKVTGSAHLLATEDQADAFWLQHVEIPTDAGTYRLLIQLPTPGLSERMQVLEINEP